MPNALTGLRLICLGTPSAKVEQGQADADILWRRNLGLLIYLALSPGQTRTREHLMGLLWPEKAQDKAAHSLNEAIRRCRASLGAGRIITAGGRVTLNPAGLDVDVWRLEDLKRRDAQDALELIRGEFLEGFHIDDAHGFEDWASRERARLGELSVAVLVQVGARELVRDNFENSRDYARRALSLQPHSESAAALAMKAAALGGDSAAALSLYHEFASRMVSQIGEHPGRDLQMLARRIRSGEWRRHSGKYPDLEPPLVGRAAQHNSLFEALRDDAPEHARFAAISGQPGTGRSRLLRECVERLSLNGAFVTVVRLLETDHDAPWNTLRALMHAGLGEAPGMAAADPQALRALAAVVPELGRIATPLASVDHRQVADALATFVSAVAEEQPLGIAIDDAQWADSATLDSLRYVWQNARDVPITFVLTTLCDASGPAHVTALLERSGRDYAGVTVRLSPFSTEEVLELVHSMAPWCESEAERDRLARRVTLESAGNPFWAVTLLRDLNKVVRLKEDLLTWPPPGSTYDAPLPFSIPSMVRVAIVARVARLTEEATAVIRAASVCGLSLNTELVGVLTGLAPHILDAALDELERVRLVAHVGERYVFNGKLIPDVIRSECVSRGEQRQFRREAVVWLDARDDLESRSLRTELLIADAQHAAAVESALELVESAIVVGATRTALRALSTAESAAPYAEPKQRIRMDEYRVALVE